MTASKGIGRGLRLTQISRKHGHAERDAHSGAYKAWRSMRQRCLYPSQQSYPLYGGRGITICDRWSSFANFLADMGERPEGMSLDRIDSNGNYEPNNCRWATTKDQARNRPGRTRLLSHEGETLSVVEWAEKTGIPSGTIRSRIDRCGWSVALALSTPVDRPTLLVATK